MCRFGCTTTNTTYMCKWCGTRYCKECLRGEFTGEMKEETHCRVCNQRRCQGKRVEYVEGHSREKEDSKGRRGRGAASRSKSKAGGKKKGKKGKAGGKKKGTKGKKKKR